MCVSFVVRAKLLRGKIQENGCVEIGRYSFQNVGMAFTENALMIFLKALGKMVLL